MVTKSRNKNERNACISFLPGTCFTLSASQYSSGVISSAYTVFSSLICNSIFAPSFIFMYNFDPCTSFLLFGGKPSHNQGEVFEMGYRIQICGLGISYLKAGVSSLWRSLMPSERISRLRGLIVELGVKAMDKNDEKDMKGSYGWKRVIAIDNGGRY